MMATTNELTEVAVNHAFVDAPFLFVTLRNAPHPLYLYVFQSLGQQNSESD